MSIPELEAGLPAYYILAMSEASSNLSRYDGIRYGLRNEVSCTSMAAVSVVSPALQWHEGPDAPGRLT